MSEQRITRYGETLGFIADGTGSDGEKRILDENRQTIGYTNQHGTFDANRRRVSDAPDAGFLLADDK